jgi:hypothetical protein
VTITRRPALVLAVVLGIVNTILENWSQPLFGRFWKHVMWEGGLIEDLTAVFFIIGAIVYVLCALQKRHRVAHRRWFGLYAFAMLMLAGEETNYGRGTLFLDLADPDFASHYNPQSGNIHNAVLPHALVPITIFFAICLVLRLFYAQIVPRLRLPMSQDFLEAVLLSGAFVVLMPFAMFDDRIQSLDEVYEWSSSLLLLCLALYYRFGWVFKPQPGDVGAAPR